MLSEDILSVGTAMTGVGGMGGWKQGGGEKLKSYTAILKAKHLPLGFFFLMKLLHFALFLQQAICHEVTLAILLQVRLLFLCDRTLMFGAPNT